MVITTSKCSNKMDPKVLENIRKLSASYHYRFTVKEPLDDVFQDVVLQLMVTKYMDRYDGSRPIHNYLSGFIYNFFCKVYRKEHYAVNQAQSLDKDINPAFSDFSLANILESDSERDMDSDLLLETIRKNLERQYPFSSFVVYTSEKNLRYVGAFKKPEYPKYFNKAQFITLTRSHSTVFHYLGVGLTQVEIKDLLHVSKSWVSKIVTSIAEVEEVKDFAEIHGFLYKGPTIAQ